MKAIPPVTPTASVLQLGNISVIEYSFIQITCVVLKGSDGSPRTVTEPKYP